MRELKSTLAVAKAGLFVTALVLLTIPILKIFQFDVFEMVGRSPGIGWKKNIAFQVSAIVVASLYLGIITIRKEPRESYFHCVIALIIGCSLIHISHMHTMYQLRFFTTYKAKQKHNIRFVHLPTLPEVFRDESWRLKIQKFSDFYAESARRTPRLLEELHAEGLEGDLAIAATHMLFVSSLWAYGNKLEPQKVGCVSSNENIGWEAGKGELTATAYASSRIGCCNDYAYILQRVYMDAGLQSRLTSIPGHIFNEVYVEGRWFTIDANTNTIIDSDWASLGSRPLNILRFLHGGGIRGEEYRPVIAAFQDYFVEMAIFKVHVNHVTHPSIPQSIVNDLR